MSQALTQPMSLDEARGLLGAKHVEWCMAHGAAFCAQKATDQLARGRELMARAYKALELAVLNMARRV